jgi:hypothetical protein
MILLETMKIFNMIQHIVKVLNPLLKIMGLDQRVGMLWLGPFFIARARCILALDSKVYYGDNCRTSV